MKGNKNPPSDFNFQKTTELLDSLQIMLPKKLGLSDASAKKTLKTEHFYWKSPEELEKYTLEITGQDNIKYAERLLTEWQENFTIVPEYETSTTTEAPRALRGDETKTLIEKAESRTQAKVQADIKGEQKAQEFLDREKKRVENLKKFQQATKDKTVHVEIKDQPKIPLSEEQERTFADLKNEAVNHPEDLKAQIAAEAYAKLQETKIQGVTDEQNLAAATLTAETAVASLAGRPLIVEAVVLKQALNSSALKTIASDKLTQSLMVNYSDLQVKIFYASRDAASNLFGKEISDRMFEVPQSVKVLDAPTPNSTPFGVSKLINSDPQIMVDTSSGDRFIGSTPMRATFTSEAAKKTTISRISERPLDRYDFGSSLDKFKQSGKTGGQTPVTGPRIYTTNNFLRGIFSSIGNSLSNAGSSIKIFTASKIDSNTQGMMVVGGALAAIAGITAGIGTATGATLTVLGSGTTIMGFAANPVGVFSGSAFAGIIAPIAGIAGGLLKGIIEAIALPIILTIVAVPLTVALFMFIINSGAYIVPLSPLSTSLNQDNPYMLVTKTANPNKISNSAGPQTITYTVSVSATKGTLSNLAFVSSECNVVKKDKSKKNCPTEVIPAIPANTTVDPGSPYTLTFTTNIDSKFSDSLIYDSIKLQADAVDKKGVVTSGSASVCVGDCPTDCINVDDGSWSQNKNGQENLRSAIGELSGQYHDFVTKVCKGGNVNLCYTTNNPSPIGKLGECNGATYAIHFHGNNTNAPQCDITFNKCGIGSSGDARYLLAHEVTHHIQDIDPSWEQKYDASSAWNEVVSTGFCSYYNTHNPKYTYDDRRSESMAEGDALYVGTPSWVSCVNSYQSLYPRSYSFARDPMFAP